MLETPRLAALMLVASLSIGVSACATTQAREPSNAQVPPAPSAAEPAQLAAAKPPEVTPPEAKPSENAAAPDACAFPATEEALLQCRRGDNARAEKALREVVGALSTTYQSEPDLAAALTAAQSTWLAFRDAECKLRTYDSRDGTAFEAYWLECVTALARERITTLKYMQEHP